jgi:hypothetical protein
MIAAVILAAIALSLSLVQFLFGILGIASFFVTIVNCFCATSRFGLLAAAIIECSISGIFLVHSIGSLRSCDPETFRYLPCETWALFTASALWFLSGSLIFYFVFSGRIARYHKQGSEIEAFAAAVEMTRQSEEDPPQPDEEDDGGEGVTEGEGEGQSENTNVNTSDVQIEDTDEKQDDSVPFTPATRVDQLGTGTIAYLPNGNRDPYSL